MSETTAVDNIKSIYSTINFTEYAYFRYGFAFVDQDTPVPQLSIPAVRLSETEMHPAAWLWRNLLIKHHHESLRGESPRRLQLFNMISFVEQEYGDEISPARQLWFPEIEVY